MRVFRGRLSIFMCILLSPFGFEGGMWDLIVLNPDHCLSVCFTTRKHLITSFVVVFFVGGGGVRGGRGETLCLCF